MLDKLINIKWEPLWMPKGSVRAMITLGLTAAVILMDSVPKEVYAAWGMIINSYFRDRVIDKTA